MCPRGIQWLGIRSGIVLGARRPAENDLRKRPCFVETAPSGWALSSLARPATVQKTRGWWDGPVDSSTSCSRPSGKLQLWQWNGTIPAPGATGRPSDPGQRLRKLAKGRRPGDVKSAPAVCHATRRADRQLSRHSLRGGCARRLSACHAAGPKFVCRCVFQRCVRRAPSEQICMTSGFWALPFCEGPELLPLAESELAAFVEAAKLERDVG